MKKIQYQEKKITIPSYINWMRLQRVPSHNISYLEYGDSTNDKVIICLHGVSRNAHDFDYLADSLSKDFRVISINIPGRGTSDWFENKKLYNYDTYVKDVCHLITTLDLKNINWIGSSMGGVIGMMIASLYPKIIKNMVLNDIGPNIPGDVLSKIKRFLPFHPRYDTLEHAKSLLKKSLAHFGIKNEEDWDYITKHSFSLTQSGKYKMAYDPCIGDGMGVFDFEDVGDSNLWRFWYRIKCPILLIRGSKSVVLTESTANQMLNSKAANDIELYCIENVGHTPSLMYEEQMQAVKNWLILRN